MTHDNRLEIHKTWRRLVVVTAIVVSAVWTIPNAHPSAAQAADRPVPFKVGEVLTYDVSWSTTLTAGTATMTVKERRASGAGGEYDFVAEGKPSSLLDKLYHLYYKAESQLGTQSFRPSLATVFSDENGRKKLRTTRFTGPTSVEFRPKDSAPFEKHTAPAQALDPLSAIYVIRSVPLRAGQAPFTMPVVDGSDVYNVRWQIAGPEPIQTPLGAMSAWRITPTLSDGQGRPIVNKKVTLYLSNDARKLPLKFVVGLPVGNFVLTLARVTG